MLTPTQKYYFIFKECDSVDFNKKEKETENTLYEIAQDFLFQFGLPLPRSCICLSCENSKNLGEYNEQNVLITIYSKNIINSGIRYYETILHESVHMLLHFIVSNRLSKSNIDKFNESDFKKMVQLFFKTHNKHIEIQDDFFYKFKNFIKTELFFEDDKIAILFQDIIRGTSGKNTFFLEILKNINLRNFFFSLYRVDIDEILANLFSKREMCNFFSNIKLTYDELSYINYFYYECKKYIQEIKPQNRKYHNFFYGITKTPIEIFRIKKVLWKTKSKTCFKNSIALVETYQNIINDNLKILKPQINEYNKQRTTIKQFREQEIIQKTIQEEKKFKNSLKDFIKIHKIKTTNVQIIQYENDTNGIKASSIKEFCDIVYDKYINGEDIIVFEENLTIYIIPKTE